MTVSVVIPVFNGEEFLAEVLESLRMQELSEQLEVLVIDSGSTDSSVEIARRAGVDLLEIPNSQFQHGRTRNLGVQRTNGRLIAFLTQDATPASNTWMQAYIDAFELDNQVGAAYGPHLPRPGVNPMMARMLTEFFHGFSPSGEPVIHRGGDLTFLSNSNSCIARAAWEEIPFREIPYSEDQALGVDLLEAGWSKVYMPAAAALHSHDYGLAESCKRYFDEYRGLRESTGHIEKASAGGALKIVASSVAADARWVNNEHGKRIDKTILWTGKSMLHHSGRVVFGALGARADRLPPAVRRAISLEGRGDGTSRKMLASVERTPNEDVRRVFEEGPTPLRAVSTSDVAREKLHVAWVVPPFLKGSGGHSTIFRMVQALEQQGHRCSIWVHDPDNLEPTSGAGLRQRINTGYRPVKASVDLGFKSWIGADVVVATGWQTVYPTLLLPNCGERAYFVQDHEPEFYPSSSESVFAAQSYGFGLHCITASPWLAELMRSRYSATATPFELGVDGSEYFPEPAARSKNTVVYYARNFTARRAVELGILALEEVVRRRPDTNIALFGTDHRINTPFDYEHVGVVNSTRLRELYCQSAVGLSTSLTNYSLIPKEMLACGLPVVELAGRACESVFGSDNEILTLAQDNPVSIADAICELLDSEELRQHRSQAGIEFVAERPWENSFDIVVTALQGIFAERVRSELPRASAASPDGSREWQAGSLI